MDTETTPSTATAIAIRYAETSQVTRPALTANDSRISGSATASIVELSGASTPPSETVSSKSARFGAMRVAG